LALNCINLELRISAEKSINRSNNPYETHKNNRTFSQ